MTSPKLEVSGFSSLNLPVMLQMIFLFFLFGEKFHMWNFNQAQFDTAPNIFAFGIEKLRLVLSVLKGRSCDSGNVPYNFLQRNR